MHHMYHIDMNVYNTCDGTKHKYKIPFYAEKKIYAFVCFIFVCLCYCFGLLFYMLKATFFRKKIKYILFRFRSKQNNDFVLYHHYSNSSSNLFKVISVS